MTSLESPSLDERLRLPGRGGKRPGAGPKATCACNQCAKCKARQRKAAQRAKGNALPVAH